jgi:hypothetical protein
MDSTTPIQKLELLVAETEKTSKLPLRSAERAASTLLEWGQFRALSKEVIAYHRGHVTETIHILGLVSRLQKAFGEIYSSKSHKDKEWLEGTFPRLRPAINELVKQLKKGG